MARRPRAQLIEIARRRNQRILLALARAQARIEQPFAHAERGEHHLRDLGPEQDVFEHQRGIRQQRPPGRGDDFDLRQRFRMNAAHQPAEFQRLLGAHHIAVHDVQRVAGLRHVEPGERAPGAADRVEYAALARLDVRHLRQRLPDDLVRLLDRFSGAVLQREAAERQRGAALDACAFHVDQFERAAAEIADDAVRPMKAGHHAERGELRFAFAGDHVDMRAADALRLAR